MKEVVHGGGSRGAFTATEVAELPPPPRSTRHAPSDLQPPSASQPAVQLSTRTAANTAATGGSSDEEGFSVPDAAAIRWAEFLSAPL